MTVSTPAPAPANPAVVLLIDGDAPFSSLRLTVNDQVAVAFTASINSHRLNVNGQVAAHQADQVSIYNIVD